MINYMESKNKKDIDFKEKTSIKLIIQFIIQIIFVVSTLYILHVSVERKDLIHAIDDKGKFVGDSIVHAIQQALDVGIPFSQIQGGNDYLDDRLNATPELSYLVWTDANGQVLATSRYTNYDTYGLDVSEIIDGLQGRLQVFAESQKEIQQDLKVFHLYSFYNIPIAIVRDQKTIGYLHVGISENAITSKIENVSYDVAIIVMIALMISYELLQYLFRNNVTEALSDLKKGIKHVVHHNYQYLIPVRKNIGFGYLLNLFNQCVLAINKRYQMIHSRLKRLKNTHPAYLYLLDLLTVLEKKYSLNQEGAAYHNVKPIIGNLRLIMFLVVFSDAMLLPAIPSYAAQFYVPSMPGSSTLLGAISVIVYMLSMAIMIPFVSKISDRFYFRTTFMLCGIFMAMGYFVGLSFYSLTGFLISRMLTGCGYSLGYVSCQNYISAYSTPENKTEALSIFGFALGAGFICGSPIGGILIDNIGYRALFGLSGVLSLVCAFVSYQSIDDIKKDSIQKKSIETKKFRDLFKLKDLVLFSALSVMPTRFMYSAVVCFLYPLYLLSLNNSQSTIGRIMMLYGVYNFLFSKWTSKLILKSNYFFGYTLISSMMIALTMMIDSFFKNTGAIVFELSIVTFSLIVYTKSTLRTLDYMSQKYKDNYDRSSITSFYFLFERIGMIFGPGITTLFLTVYDFSHTLLYLGMCLLIFNMVYLMILFVRQLKFYFKTKDRI